MLVPVRKQVNNKGVFIMLEKLSAYISGPAGLFLFIFFFIPWVSITCTIPFFLDDTSVMNASGYELATGQSADELAQRSCELALNEGGSLAGLASPENLGPEFSEALGGTGTVDIADEVLQSCDDITFDEFFAATDSGTTSSTDPLAVADSATTDDLDPAAFDPIQADALLWVIPLVALLALVVAGVRFAGLLDGMLAGTALILLTIGGAAVLTLKYMEFQDLRDYLQTATETTDEETGITVGGVANLNYEPGWYVAILSLLVMFVAGVIGFFEGDLRPQRAPRNADVPVPDMSMFEQQGTAGPTTGGASQTPKRPSWLDD